MSIQSEIDRINGAKDSIVTSIQNKGVSVPDGTKIDGISTYVDAIPTASGGGSAIYLYKTSSANDFRNAIASYINNSTAVIYSDDDYELCFLVGVLDLAGEPKYYFLKLSKDEYIVVSTNVDFGTVSIARRNVDSRSSETSVVVTTTEEMDKILNDATDANVGTQYVFAGPTGKYNRGSTYMVTRE